MGTKETGPHSLTKHYRDMMKFLALVCGVDTELVLTDTSSILHVENPMDPKTAPGAPLGEREKNFLQDREYEGKECIVNYRALSDTGDRLRASTMIIRDEKGKPAGTFTINSRVENLIRVRQIVDNLINGDNSNLNVQEPKTAAVYENLSVSLEDMVAETVDKGLMESGVPAERLTPAEKKKIVHELDQKGVFMVKGAISIVAKRLSSSDATIYRYLQHFNGE